MNTKQECCTILGVRFDALTNAQTVERLLSFLSGTKKHMVFTPNPEMVMAALKDAELFQILKDASLVMPDGIGVVLASRFYGNKIKERVAGCDIVPMVFDRIKDTDKTVYFFGGGKGVAAAAKVEMCKKYKNLKIVGVSDGYFDAEREKIIIEEINRLKPDLLLVGLGVPKQEKWIAKHIQQLNVKVCIGVGGSFDVFSGQTKRAPKAFRQLGLEWFYRLLTQPTRLMRMMQLPLFAVTVLMDKKKK